MQLPRPWKRWLLEFFVRIGQVLRSFRNRFKGIEVELYDINKSLEPLFKTVNSLLTLMALASLVASEGFVLEDPWRTWNNYLDFAIVIGFLSTYLGRFLLTSSKMKLLRSRLIETVLFILFVIFGLAFGIGRESFITNLENLLRIDNLLPLLLLVTKIYLIVLVTEKFIRAAPILISLRQHPAKVVSGSFITVILAGALLLMTPNATVDGNGLGFIDAVFTSTSALCVTGLSVVDTATHLSRYGQIIILILIQVGGLGILTIATLFALFVSSDLGIGQMSFLKGVIGQNQTHETFSTIKRIIGITLFIEFLGFAGYYYSWSGIIGNEDILIFYSLFHAVSAFCNAGFSLFTDSFSSARNALNTGVNITSMLLIIIGGLGFTTIWEVIKGNPNRRFRNWQFSVHTRLVLISTAVLLVAGFAAVLLLEWDGVLKGYETSDKLWLAMFQSVTSRTAGFNTLDISLLNSGTTLFIMLLMIIGASPASTAGGLKNTTVSVLLLSVISTLKGKRRVEISKRTISHETIMTAVSVFSLAAACLFIFTLILTLTEEHAFLDLLFEQFSAFATVGLSRGITADLSDTGKVVISASMFIGRVGIVTLAYAFAQRSETKKYKYPTESVIVA